MAGSSRGSDTTSQRKCHNVIRLATYFKVQLPCSTRRHAAYHRGTHMFEQSAQPQGSLISWQSKHMCSPQGPSVDS